MGQTDKDHSPTKLITAEILYQTPGRPHVIQSFLWQDYDVGPSYPQLTRFLRFWSTRFDVTLHSVNFADRDELKRPEMHYVGYSLSVH